VGRAHDRGGVLSGRVLREQQRYNKQSAESQEVSEGVVLDYDAEGNLVGIDIDHASQKLNLCELVTSHIPLGAKAQS
jgi:uncharacterized protein YuzE